MRKFLAVAILISFVAPASARGFINGLNSKYPESTSTSHTLTEEQKKRFKPFWDRVLQERQLDAAQAQADRADASSRDAQDRRNKAKDALRKLLDSRRL